jgi:CHAD domain-containing protein
MTEELSRYGLLHFYCQERAKFDRSLFISRKTLEPEAIHQYRVALKRIRALFHMLEFITRGKFESDILFHPVRAIFKPGGNLRDIHVQLELLEDYEETLDMSFDKIREFLFFMEIRSQRKFLKRTRKSIEKPMDKLMWNLKGIADNITEDEFNQGTIDWIYSEMNFLKEIHGHIHDPKVFHRFRRHQKETFYMIDFINKYTSGQIAIEGSLKNMKIIAKKIGDWHDQHNILSRVNYIHHLYNDARLKITKECISLEEYLLKEHEQLFSILLEDLDDDSLFNVKLEVPVQVEESNPGFID